MAITLFALEMNLGRAAQSVLEKEQLPAAALRFFCYQTSGSHAFARPPLAVMFPHSRLGPTGFPDQNDFLPAAPSKTDAERFVLGRGLIFRNAVTRG
jgi:hypothetical protein